MYLNFANFLYAFVFAFCSHLILSSLSIFLLGENLEPISDERAHRVLHRVNLLNTIRNKVCLFVYLHFF